MDHYYETGEFPEWFNQDYTNYPPALETIIRGCKSGKVIFNIEATIGSKSDTKIDQACNASSLLQELLEYEGLEPDIRTWVVFAEGAPFSNNKWDNNVYRVFRKKPSKEFSGPEWEKHLRHKHFGRVFTEADFEMNITLYKKNNRDDSMTTYRLSLENGFEAGGEIDILMLAKESHINDRFSELETHRGFKCIYSP